MIIKLSRRNLLTLLRQMEECVDAWLIKPGGTYVFVEPDEVHYADRKNGPGPVNSQTEQFIKDLEAALKIVRRGQAQENVKVEANKPQVTIVSSDDWKGLYVNGQLIEESHHIGTDDVLGYLGIPCDVIYPDEAWLEEQGCLPVELSEVKE